MMNKEAVAIQLAFGTIGIVSLLWFMKINWSEWSLLQDYVSFLFYVGSGVLFSACWLIFAAAVNWWLAGYYQHHYEQGGLFF